MARKSYTDIKRRYNEKVYTRLTYMLPKDLAEAFKEKCARTGISQRSVIQEAMENFVNKE